LDQDRRAERVLDRFAIPMGLAVSQVMRDRCMESDSSLRDELEQEARVLVITYAGLLRGWHSGKLNNWTAEAKGDEEQINLLVTNSLKMDLGQILGRQLQKGDRLVSLDLMLEQGIDPADNHWEDRVTDHIDNRSQGRRYRELYPTLARNVLDGFTQEEIAEADGVDARTVRRHIAKEKRAFLLDFVQRRGLTVDGDETMEELTEAYENLIMRKAPASPFVNLAA
jgi:hypothetical protein